MAAVVKGSTSGSASTMNTATEVMATSASPQLPRIAAPKVFGVAELLEAILLNLSQLDLVRLLEVSKAFKNTIERSVKIQQTLFLEASPQIAEGYATVNPCTLRILRHYGITCQLETQEIPGACCSRGYAEGSCDYIMSHKERCIILSETGIMTFEVLKIDQDALPRLPLRGSHKDMLLADPPVQVFIKPIDGPYINHGDINIRTIGDLIEAYIAPEVLQDMKVGVAASDFNREESYLSFDTPDTACS